MTEEKYLKERKNEITGRRDGERGGEGGRGGRGKGGEEGGADGEAGPLETAQGHSHAHLSCVQARENHTMTFSGV